MFNMIDKYMQNISIDKIRNFASSKGAILSEEELNFTYDFIKRNYKDILKNPSLFDIDRYKNKFSNENFPKIKKAYFEYYSKYKRFL